MRFQRSRKGSAIVETGPALYLFLIVIFFPVLDIMGYAAQYGCAWYHNHLMLEELAVRTQAEGSGGTVHNEVRNKFNSTGLPGFFRINPTDPTAITDTITYPGGNPPVVACSTTLTGAPFIEMPVFGLTKTKFTIAGEAVRENTR